MSAIQECYIKIFADDTKVHNDSDMQSDGNRNLLQNSIDTMMQWTKDWQIKFSNDKCKIVRVGNPYLNILWMAGSFSV